MNPNKRLREFSGSINQKLNYYGYATKDLDVPTTPESIDLFWDTFSPDITSGQFTLNDSKLANSTFYIAVEKYQNDLKEKKEFITLINGYNAKVLKNNIKYILLEDGKAALDGVMEDKQVTPAPLTPEIPAQTVQKQTHAQEQQIEQKPQEQPAQPEQPVQQPVKPEPPSKVEEAEKSNTSNKANTANTANTAGLADGLTPEARKAMIEEMLMEHERNLYNRQNTYSYNKSEGDFTTKNIYTDSLYTEALYKLREKHRLVITGQTGAGKSELAYLLAHELTGENVGKGNRVLKRVYTIDAGQCLVGDGIRDIGALGKFTKHIKDNNITEPCVLICNEIHRVDFEFLIGSELFEYFSDDELPDNLRNVYLIFTHTKAAASIPIDEQIEHRFPVIEVTYISKKSKSIDEQKLKEAFCNYSNTNKIIKLALAINTIEEDNKNSHGISTRMLIRKIKSGDNTLIPEKYENILQSESKRMLRELRSI